MGHIVNIPPTGHRRKVYNADKVDPIKGDMTYAQRKIILHVIDTGDFENRTQIELLQIICTAIVLNPLLYLFFLIAVLLLYLTPTTLSPSQIL